MNKKNKMASGSPNIVAAGSITFGGFINGKRQYLIANGVADAASAPNGVATVAVVGVQSKVTRVAWQFERNTRHWFRLMRNGAVLTDLQFPAPSGVLLLDPLTVDPGDALQMYCYHDYWENRFPGPILVTLYMEAM